MSKDNIDRIATILGWIGRCLVFIGLGCFAILVWFLIINNLIK